MFANVTASRGKHREISRKIRESFANVPLKSRFGSWHEAWVELCLTLFGTIVVQMLQVTLSNCGNIQPSTGVMLQDVSPYFVIL